jgi:hypothetical protein
MRQSVRVRLTLHDIWCKEPLLSHDTGQGQEIEAPQQIRGNGAFGIPKDEGAEKSRLSRLIPY